MMSIKRVQGGASDGALTKERKQGEWDMFQVTLVLLGLMGSFTAPNAQAEECKCPGGWREGTSCVKQITQCTGMSGLRPWISLNDSVFTSDAGDLRQKSSISWCPTDGNYALSLDRRSCSTTKKPSQACGSGEWNENGTCIKQTEFKLPPGTKAWVDLGNGYYTDDRNGVRIKIGRIKTTCEAGYIEQNVARGAGLFGQFPENSVNGITCVKTVDAKPSCPAGGWVEGNSCIIAYRSCSVPNAKKWLQLGGDYFTDDNGGIRKKFACSF